MPAEDRGRAEVGEGPGRKGDVSQAEEEPHQEVQQVGGVGQELSQGKQEVGGYEDWGEEGGGGGGGGEGAWVQRQKGEHCSEVRG